MEILEAGFSGVEGAVFVVVMLQAMRRGRSPGSAPLGLAR